MFDGDYFLVVGGSSNGIDWFNTEKCLLQNDTMICEELPNHSMEYYLYYAELAAINDDFETC